MAVEPMEVNSQSAKPNKYNENFVMLSGYGCVLAAQKRGKRERVEGGRPELGEGVVDDSWQL